MGTAAIRTDENPDEYVSGVPNRDLTDEEWAALDAEQQDEVVATGLWVVQAPEAPAPPEPTAEPA
jgi:hypothetical protein